MSSRQRDLTILAYHLGFARQAALADFAGAIQREQAYLDAARAAGLDDDVNHHAARIDQLTRRAKGAHAVVATYKLGLHNCFIGKRSGGRDVA